MAGHAPGRLSARRARPPTRQAQRKAARIETLAAYAFPFVWPAYLAGFAPSAIARSLATARRNAALRLGLAPSAFRSSLAASVAH